MNILVEPELEDYLEKKSQKKSIKQKKKSLWKTIAKNEIRIRTSSFRGHRTQLFIILYSLLFFWALVVAPLLFDMFMPTLAVEYSVIFKPVVAIVIESLMMSFFLVLVMYPLNNVYRESEIGFKESMLATPVKPNDIFLGEFLGKAPLYTIAVLILAPIIVGLINPIVNLTIIQYLIVYGCIFGLVYFANLVGSILASWLEHKISKSEKARELGKALIWIFTIVLVAIMYGVIFFLNELLTNPELKNWLAFYPSLWFSNIILYTMDPVLLNTFILNIWINLVLATGIPLLTLYISYKKAESFYTLEGKQQKINITIVKHENFFYKLIRRTTGRKWGSLTVMQLKRLFRKKSNFARIAYIFGLIGFMTWFMGGMADNNVANILFSTMLIAIGGGIGSIMLGHLAFVDSKDIIWVYKRSPRGLKGLIYSYLLAMLVINIFLAVFETVLFSILANLSLVDAIIFFVEFLLFSQISMGQAMGLQCISPAYGEKDSKMRGNTTISMLLLQPMLFLPFGLLIFLRPDTAEMMRLIMQLPVFTYIIGTSSVLLYIGMKKLNKIE